ncbi:putative rab geranylgeranyl transferase escort protein [Talaromyces proteolyticus]|uniref:Rab proteins geranylgeranyltransferase n=1 Tax=Talaromyces proteolyticus TaxID=1131652 RepID=A0AAD4KMI8_9EURO|nr:putative rab geranylgeranyl transferase escort protein [Talaromyces proteolyticus]KAH8695047.1 putative rab geranylgeranyl transferase escort protein [Talaromyces proteolyticus]
MESLADTPWDVTISGTGLAQSLLALALSRSGKKILHVDKNTYYGGAEAAFSLQEAQEWADSLNKEPGREPFEDVSIHFPSSASHGGKALASSRAYSLSLSPYLVYTRSKLLPALISSKVYRQLEFQAVGSWWAYEDAATTEGTKSMSGNIRRVPGSREDIFADDSISMKEKRMLIKILRSVNQSSQLGEEQEDAIEEDLDLSFPDYMANKFNAPAKLNNALLSLSLSQKLPQQTSASFAVPRIKRHLASMNVFGPGFCSLLAKWGCGAEIAQVGCRALAVGGGVYVLGRGIQSINAQKDDANFHSITLSDGETIRSNHIIGSPWDLPAEESSSKITTQKVARSISIISSPLEPLFPRIAEGGTIPAGAVVVVPNQTLSSDAPDSPPVYLLVHSSDTGECPDGQCVIYGSVSVGGQDGQALLAAAVNQLLESITEVENTPTVLWTLRFTQIGILDSDVSPANIYRSSVSDRIIYFPPPNLDLAFNDAIVDSVRAGWKAVLGDEAQDDDFMNFEDREKYDDDS